MRPRIVVLLSLLLVAPQALFADFHYIETTKITGGSMIGMMKIAGAFSKQARQINDPVVSSVFVKGNRMARNGPESSEIVDLDNETVTHIDNLKHTYYVVTFQQMKEQFERAQQEAANRPAPKTEKPTPQPARNTTDMKFDVAVRNTGVSRQFSGAQANESILSLTMQATDQQSGQSGNLSMTNDMWMAPEIPGYQELRDFNIRYAKKLGQVYGSVLTSNIANIRTQQEQMRPGTGEGYAEMAKETSKLKGIPVYSVMRMGSSADGKPLPAASEAPLPDQNQNAELPSKEDVAKQGASNAATSAIASKMGGLGGLMGGFGHKKKQQEPPPDSASADQSGNANADAPQEPTSVVLMESTTEMSDFSNAPIDNLHFQPPAGYQRIPLPDYPQAH